MIKLLNFIMARNIFLILLMSILGNDAIAKDINSEMLIKNCQELIAIYDRHGSKKLFAGFSTSVSEAMRAGICRGMLEEHITHDSRCNGDWHAMAQYIAQAELDVGIDVDVEKLLDRACGH